MIKGISTALGLVFLAACGTSEQPSSLVSGSAASALEAIEARDEQEVVRCGHAVEACLRNLPDAAPDDVCARLADHCGELEERLATVREPAVGCLKAVENCQAHAPEQAQCRRDVAQCAPVQEEISEERAELVDCSARIEACLARAAELPEAAGVACENIASACERAAAAPGERDAGAGDGEPGGGGRPEDVPRGRPRGIDAGAPRGD